MKELFVYRTHYWDKFIEKQYRQIQNDLGIENVYLLYDDTYNPCPLPHCRVGDAKNSSHVICTNFLECKIKNPLHKSNKEQVESQLLLFCSLCPSDYDFIWILEYDVYCDGNWKTTLKKCQDKTTDFMATCVCGHKEDIFWGLWFCLHGLRRFKPVLSERIKSFFPVVRVSKVLCEGLEMNIGKYSGFCELYFPTLAKSLGLTYNNFPPSMFGDVFVYSVEKNFTITKQNKNQLFHPFTTFDNILSTGKTQEETVDNNNNLHHLIHV